MLPLTFHLLNRLTNNVPV